jgi:hypothetical protein
MLSNRLSLIYGIWRVYLSSKDMQPGLHRRSVLAKPPAWRLCVTPALRFRGDLRRHVGGISATLTAKFFNSGLYFDFAFGMEGPCRDVTAITHGVQLRVQATFRSTYIGRAARQPHLGCAGARQCRERGRKWRWGRL